MVNLSYYNYLQFLDFYNPRAADLHDSNLRLAAQGYIDVKSIVYDLGREMYSSFYKASLKMMRDIKINKKPDASAGAEMCNAFGEACKQASLSLRSKFPNYQTPEFHELTCMGPSTREQFKDYDAFYNPTNNKETHVILVRFFTLESSIDKTYEAKTFNKFLSDIEHELTHFFQAKDYLLKTDENGNLLLSDEEFKRRTKVIQSTYQLKAKEWMIRDPKKIFEYLRKQLGNEFTEKDFGKLLPIINDLIRSETPSLWDRNDPREVSAHIGDILRQLPPPTQENLASTENFFKYVERSKSFKEYMLMVSNPEVKKKFLSTLYSAIQNKKDDPTSFEITDCATDEIFPDESKMQEKLEKDLEKLQPKPLSPPLRSMQPMQKKKKK